VVAFVYWQIDVLWSSTNNISLENLDLYTIYYPIISYGIESLKGWHIPLWNPYQALGVPFAASAYYGMFYPLSFIYFILPVHIGMGYFTALHIALAGLFTYIFLRHGLKISVIGALIGATVFMLSGSITREISHPNDLSAMAWLPLILFLVEKIFQTRKSLWGVLLGLALGFQILTMSFQTVVFSGYTVGAYSLFRVCLLYARDREGIIVSVLYLGLGIIIALCLSSIQWLPTMELSSLSVRSTKGLSINDVELLREVLTPLNIAKGMIIKNVLIYIGIIPVLLGLAALFLKNFRPYTFFFLFWSILTLVLSFGTHWPVYNFYYYYVPTGDWFRLPLRFLWLSIFSISVLAGIGSETMSKKLQQKCGVKVALLSMVLVIITMDLFYANVHVYYHHPQEKPEIFQRHSDAGRFLRKNQGLYRTYISNHGWDFSLSPRFGSLEKVYVINDYSPLTMASYRDVIGAVLKKERISKDAFFYGSYALGTNRRSKRLLDLFGVRFIIEKNIRVFGSGHPKWTRLVYKQGKLRIYENPSAMPRSFVVYDTEVISDRKKILKRLTEPSFSPRRGVILEKDSGLNIKKGRAFTKVSKIDYAPERIRVTTKTSKNGILVLTDFYYPGWKAYVDGKEVRILRANYLFRGVPLKAGRHIVEFVYDPSTFKAGWLITIFTSLTVLSYLGYSIKIRLTRQSCPDVDS